MTVTAAREYLRVSQDKSGRERSPDEQHRDHQTDAERERWVLHPTPYRDVGSASRFARKCREGYDQLIGDLEAGTFGAEVLMLWEASRGSRRMGEWVLLLDLLGERRVRLWIHTHSRAYSLTNARDRRTLLEDGTDSEYESAKASARTRRARKAEAEAGLPHGRAVFGYRALYDTAKGGRAVGWEIVSAEAEVIRELYRRVRQGHSLRQITLDFQDRGITSRGGKRLTSSWIHQLAISPTYTGLRRHRNGDGETRTYDGDEQKWPRIVDRATWYAVQDILQAPDRRKRRPGKGRHLLSMIARCAVCEGPLTSRGHTAGHLMYSCRDRGCAAVKQNDLDSYAEQVILTYLSDPANLKRLTRDNGDGAELAAARDALASVQAELDDLADQVGRGELSARLAARAEPAIKERLQAAQQRVSSLETPSVLSGLLGPAGQIEHHWADAPMAAKREIARLLFTPERLGQLRVKRSPRPRQKVDVHERVEWVQER